jgi:hypothetical protein
MPVYRGGNSTIPRRELPYATRLKSPNFVSYVSYPFAGCNSLLAGNLAGNVAKSGRIGAFQASGTAILRGNFKVLDVNLCFKY